MQLSKILRSSPAAPPQIQNARPQRPLTPGEREAARRTYDNDVRQMQDANRFQRKRAVADGALYPFRTAFGMIGIPIPGLSWIGIGLRIPGTQYLKVNTHEGKDPTRLRTHLFERETSRHQSRKIVASLRKMGVLTSDNRYQRAPTREELDVLKDQYHLSGLTTAKVFWATETLKDITAEAQSNAPSPWEDALPPARP